MESSKRRSFQDRPTRSVCWLLRSAPWQLSCSGYGKHSINVKVSDCCIRLPPGWRTTCVTTLSSDRNVAGSQLATEADVEQRLANVIKEWTESKLDLPEEESSELYQRFLAATGPALLRALMQKLGGNLAAAAERLKMDRGTLRERLNRYGLLLRR